MSSSDRYRPLFKSQLPIPREVAEVPPAVRAASDELEDALEHERAAIEARTTAEAALRLAEHRDTVAAADALRVGAKAPKPATPGAQADLEAARRTLELRSRITRDAQARLVATVFEHRAAWLEALRDTAAARLEHFLGLLAQVDAALTACATAGAAVARIEECNGRTAIDLRAVVEVTDMPGMLASRSSTLIEALATMARRSSGETIGATPTAIQQRARTRRLEQRRASKEANKRRKVA